MQKPTDAKGSIMRSVRHCKDMLTHPLQYIISNRLINVKNRTCLFAKEARWQYYFGSHESYALHGFFYPRVLVFNSMYTNRSSQDDNSETLHLFLHIHFHKYKNKIVHERSTSSHRRKIVFVYRKIFTYIIKMYSITKNDFFHKKYIHLDHFLLLFIMPFIFLLVVHVNCVISNDTLL